MRELFTDSIRAGLANIDLHDLKEPAPDAKAPELIFKDSASNALVNLSLNPNATFP